MLPAEKKAIVQDLIRSKTEVLYCAALGMGFSAVDAEELVQASFVSLLEGLDRFEGRSQISTYLFSILYHKAVDQRRRSHRQDDSQTVEEAFERQFDRFGYRHSSPEGPEESVLNKDLAGWIERCTETLTEEQRMAFYLKVVEEIETEEISKILGVTATNLGVILFRARNKLRDCLERHWKNA